MEPSDFLAKQAAYQAVIQMQARMLEALHRQCFEQKQALQEAEAAWDEASCEHEREVAALRGVFENLRGAVPTFEESPKPLLLQANESSPERNLSYELTGFLNGEVTPRDKELEESTRVEDLEAALSDAKIEAIEAEQERARWEARAQRTMNEASAVLQEERTASETRAENLERLLTYAEARIQELESECEQQTGRADRAEAAAARLEDAMAAAQALWAGSRQRERDWEETAGFLQGQLAVAQSQAKIARLRLVQQQSGIPLGVDPYSAPHESISGPEKEPTKAEPASHPTVAEYGGKENATPAVVSFEGAIETKSVERVFGKRSVRFLPARPVAQEKDAGPSKVGARIPLSEVANFCNKKGHGMLGSGQKKGKGCQVDIPSF